MIAAWRRGSGRTAAQSLIFLENPALEKIKAIHDEIDVDHANHYKTARQHRQQFDPVQPDRQQNVGLACHSLKDKGNEIDQKQNADVEHAGRFR